MLDLERLEDRCLPSCGDPLTSCAALEYVGYDPVERDATAVVVAVIDTGVNCYSGLRCVPGFDFVDRDYQPDDPQGHGTAVASVIGERLDGVGIAGMAPGTLIMPIRVLDQAGRGTFANVARGINYAVVEGARVINLSLGGTSNTEELRDAVEYATAQGVIVVAAAGNQRAVTLYPAAIPDVLSVAAAYPPCDCLEPWSATGDIAASGDGVRARALRFTSERTPTGYRWFDGTSLSSALVSGALAAVLAEQPGLTRTQLIDRAEALPTTKDGVPRLDAGALLGVYQTRGFDFASALLYGEKS